MKKILILVAGFTIVACSSQSPKDNPVLVEANLVHLEAEAIQAQVEPEIVKIDKLKKLLIGQKNANADSLAKELTKIKTDFENWEKNFFAVPGFEHKHENGHHHHDHFPAPELPADKMLEVQKEIRTSIERIKTDLNHTLVQVKEMLK